MTEARSGQCSPDPAAIRQLPRDQLDIPEIRGIQASKRERDVATVKRRFEQLQLDEIAWAAIRI
jgi:hypothetical protein